MVMVLLYAVRIHVNYMSFHTSCGLVCIHACYEHTHTQLDVAQVEVDLYREQFTSKEKQHEKAKQNLATIKSSIKEKKRLVVALAIRTFITYKHTHIYACTLSHTHSELACVQSTLLPTKKKELAKTDSELKVVREKAEKLSQLARSGRAQVEEARSSLQAHRSQGRVLQSLLKQKEEGTIPGIHGRLVCSITVYISPF